MHHAASITRGEAVNHSLTDRNDGQKWPGPAPFAVFRSRFRVQTCRIFPFARVGVRKSAARKKGDVSGRTAPVRGLDGPTSPFGLPTCDSVTPRAGRHFAILQGPPRGCPVQSLFGAVRRAQTPIRGRARLSILVPERRPQRPAEGPKYRFVKVFGRFWKRVAA
jgi:hypothetical protein